MLEREQMLERERSNELVKLNLLESHCVPILSNAIEVSLNWMTVVNFALLTTASFVSTTDTLNLCVSYKLS